MIRTLFTAAALSALMATAACSDREDDVVQAPAPGAAPAPVSETRANTATTAAAVALGMTHQQLEDADLISGDNLDMGDVETLVLDQAGQVTHVVIELEGPGDRRVSVPIDQLSSIKRNNDDVDLTTTLTGPQLSAMPVWTQ